MRLSSIEEWFWRPRIRRKINANRPENGDGCANEHTTKNGLSFNVLCGQNIEGHNLLEESVTADDAQGCMDLCSAPYPYANACYGIAFDTTTHRCRLKASNVTSDPTSSDAVRPAPRVTSALADRDQLVPLDTDCPYPDDSTQRTAGGEPFRIGCFQNHYGDDYHPAGWPWHAASLDECMALCEGARPLCGAVSYNPDMTYSYSNCFPKTAIRVRDTEPALIPVSHVAVARLPRIENTCEPDEVRATPAGTNFALRCGQRISGREILARHEDSLEDCLSACAESGGDCVAVVFDWTMEDGYQNCYLKASNTAIEDDDGTISAVLTRREPTLPTPQGPDTSAGDSGGNSTAASGIGGDGASSDDTDGNMAWTIAGPFIAAVVTALLLGGIYLWRRKRRARKHLPTYGPRKLSPMSAEKDGWPVYQLPSDDAGVPIGRPDRARLQGLPPSELGGGPKCAYPIRSAPPIELEGSLGSGEGFAGSEKLSLPSSTKSRLTDR